jgi:methionyl-tRNA synthetase
MATIALEVAKQLFARHRTERDGISDIAEMASVCLICGSPHIDAVPGEDGKFVCRNCGFGFARSTCETCGKTVDSRDSKHPKCGDCGKRICVCGRCNCPSKVGE